MESSTFIDEQIQLNEQINTAELQIIQTQTDLKQQYSVDYLLEASIDLFTNLTINEKDQFQSINTDLSESNKKQKSQNQENEESGDDENTFKEEQDEKIQQILSMSSKEWDYHKNSFPSRNIFQFENGLRVTSDFDGGNLQKCVKVQSKNIYFSGKNQSQQMANIQIKGIPDEIFYSFEMYITPDSLPYMPDSQQGKAGFFFAITGILQEDKKSDDQGFFDYVPRTLRFHFKGLSNQQKLLSYGHTPVYLEATKEEFFALTQGKLAYYKQKWKRVPGIMDQIKNEEGLEAIFHFTVKSTLKKSDYIFFSYAYPFTYQDQQYSILELQNKCEKYNYHSINKIHYFVQKIGDSLEQRPIEMITLCSQSAKLSEKPVVFFTGRVHSGESPASYMLQSVLDMLTEFDNIQTQILLDNYVFKIIPMLNPDGVARGYWRFDILGLNLNRFYTNPNQNIHPSIYAAKKSILQEHKNGKLKMYVDFHAHCTKRGCFIYGNTLSDPDLQLEAKIIPKLMSLNSVNFDFQECNFQDEKNNIKDKKGDSRDGSGRAVIFREADLNPLTYTFEANYCTGVRINVMQQRYDIINDKKIIKEDQPAQDISSQMYRGRKSPIFTPQVYYEVGRSLLISLLDYDEKNPISRLLKVKGETLSSALQKIRKDMKKQDEKPSIGQIKKKLGVGSKKGKKSNQKIDNFEIILSKNENINCTVPEEQKQNTNSNVIQVLSKKSTELKKQYQNIENN